MQSLAIVGLCVLASIVYGIAHDQVTARVCVEYFTIGHPPIFGTDSPTMLGIGWGIVASWWMGLLLGLGLALAARAGQRPKRQVQSLVVPIALLMVFTACAAVMAGVTGYCLASLGAVKLTGSLASDVPPHRHVAFLADLWAHTASYLVGGVGGLVVIVQTWRSRRKPVLNSSTA
jgi:hypothetical protein